MCCTDWFVICASSRKWERKREKTRGIGWGGDTQMYGNTAWIFHLPAAASITFSQGSRCGFCSARESLERQAWQPWEFKGARKTEEVGSLAMVAGQMPGGQMCWSLGCLVLFEKTTDMCVVVTDVPGRFPVEGVRLETGCLSLEKLPNPLCQFGSCCRCMMGKKNIPPSLWKHPDLNTDSDE